MPRPPGAFGEVSSSPSPAGAADAFAPGVRGRVEPGGLRGEPGFIGFSVAIEVLSKNWALLPNKLNITQLFTAIRKIFFPNRIYLSNRNHRTLPSLKKTRIVPVHRETSPLILMAYILGAVCFRDRKKKMLHFILGKLVRLKREYDKIKRLFG